MILLCIFLIFNFFIIYKTIEYGIGGCLNLFLELISFYWDIYLIILKIRGII